MSQTSDSSRTFRVLNLTDDVKSELEKLNVVVTQHENVNYLEVSSTNDIESVRKMLDDSEIKYKQCSYSTFVRFKDTLTLEQLNQSANELAENVNILYSRVDENNHTGKLVVDRLEDYNKLKNSTGDINYYRFSPLNVPRVQNRNYQGRSQEDRAQNGEWQTVQPHRGQRNNTVRGQYTQQRQEQNGSSYVSAVRRTETRTEGAPREARGGEARGDAPPAFSRGGRGGGRGGATRGRTTRGAHSSA